MRGSYPSSRDGYYFNDKNGVKDCSRGNTYHNKNFKATAEACDLVVEHHSSYGWSITSPSDSLLEFCVENNLTEIRLNRNDMMSIAVGVSGTHAGTFTGTAGRKPSSTRKYICPLLRYERSRYKVCQYRLSGLQRAAGDCSVDVRKSQQKRTAEGNRKGE